MDMDPSTAVNQAEFQSLRQEVANLKDLLSHPEVQETLNQLQKKNREDVAKTTPHSNTNGGRDLPLVQREATNYSPNFSSNPTKSHHSHHTTRGRSPRCRVAKGQCRLPGDAESLVTWRFEQEEINVLVYDARKKFTTTSLLRNKLY